MADEIFCAVEDDDLVAGCSTGELEERVFGVELIFGDVEVGFFAGAFDENFYGFSDEILVVFVRNLILQFEQFGVALAFDGVGDVINHFVVGAGAGPGRVFEDEAVFVADFFDECFGIVEILVVFVAVADDEITGDGDAGDDVAGFLD